MMIIATKDGCIREFNDNVDKKALEFGDAADKKMDEAIKRFNEATKTNKRMSIYVIIGILHPPTLCYHPRYVLCFHHHGQ